jgi:hypothetical protein
MGKKGRALTSKSKGTTSSLDNLAGKRSADLYAALAFRVSQASSESSEIARFDAPLNVDSLDRANATVELGYRIFQRWNRALHGFVCGSDDQDKDIRDRLLRAITGKDGAVALIAGLLVSYFGASPAIAAIVAALLIQIIGKPAREEICSTWKEKLK